MLKVLDVSDDQGVIAWDRVKTAGDVAGVVAQATEGLTIVNSTFRANHDGCKAQSIPFAGYHFFYGKDDGEAQARHFLSVINGLEGQIVPMVDVEEDSLAGFTGSAIEFTAQLVAFDIVLRASLPPGKLPLIYFEYSFWKNYLGGYDGFSGHPAWPAAYNSDATLDMTGTGWKKWTLWQYAEDGIVPGISTHVDLSHVADDDLTAILR